MWNTFFNQLDYQVMKPEILLTMFALAILLADPVLFRDRRDKIWNAVFASLGLAFALFQLVMFRTGFASGLPQVAFDGRFTLDLFALVLKLIIVLATFLVVM